MNQQPCYVVIEMHTSSPTVASWSRYDHDMMSPTEELLYYAKTHGYRAVVVTFDPAYYHDERQLVDVWIQTDTTNPMCIVEALQRAGLDVAAISCQVDNFVGITAQVAAVIGVRGPDAGSPALVRDKYRARRCVSDCGLGKSVRFAESSFDDKAATAPISYPCVVKPVDGAASWDVSLLMDDEDLRRIVRQHEDRPYPRGVKKKHEYLFEEYVAGPVVSCEGVVDRCGKVVILGWTTRLMTPLPDFCELALTFAVDEPYAGGNSFVRSILKALHYDFGAFHLEMIWHDGEYFFVELNPRIVGSGAHRCITAVTGISPYRRLLELTVDIGDESGAGTAGAASQVYIIARHEGAMHSIPSGEELERMITDNTYEIGITANVGDRVTDHPTSSSDYLGWVTTVSSDRASALAASCRLAGTIAEGIGVEV